MPFMGGGGGGSSPVQIATVTLSQADILALPTAPVVIVPAPDTGMLLPLHGAWTFLLHDAYANINPNCLMGVYYDSDNAPLVDAGQGGGNITVDDLLGHARNNGVRTPPEAAILSGDPGAQVTAWETVLGGNSEEGLNVRAFNGGSGNFTGGDPADQIIVAVVYVTVPTVL